MTEPDPNAAQRSYWSNSASPHWLGHEDYLDRAMAPVLRVVLDAAALRLNERVLDIGCGTGASALAAAAAVGPGGQVTALDIAAPLLDRAAARAVAAGARVEFLLADAQTADFAPVQDVAISRFGVMFFADPVAAFANIARALAPGGRLVCAAWGPLADNPWFHLAARAATARLGPAPPAEPGTPDPMAFADAARVAGILTAAGLAEVAMQPVALELDFAPDPAGVAAELVTSGPAARAIRAAGAAPALVAEIAGEVEAALRPWLQADALRIPARINLITARRG